MTDIETVYKGEQAFGTVLSSCVACRSTRLNFWKQKTFAASAQAEIQAFKIFRCEDCGSGFLNPPPAADYLTKVYAKSGHGLTEAVTLEEVEEAERRFPNSSIDAARMAAAAARADRSSSKRALDVGSGYGWGTKAMTAQGYDVVAINPGAYENSVFAQMNHFLPISVMFEDYRADGRFGVIFLSQVLEHVVDPGCMVARLVDMLEPGGAVVIAVPNFASFSVKLLGTRDNSCLWVPEHVNYFTRQGLVSLLRHEGLSIEAVRDVSRIRYDALSRRFGLHGILGRLGRVATNWLQVLPCRIADLVGCGLYLNVVAVKPRNDGMH
jgi:SAM-dependent methyltransferase